MKRILSIGLILAISLTLLAGCGGKDRVLYNVKLSKYVDLGDYKDIEVDTSTEEFDEAYQSVVDSDVESYDLYKKKTEGEVADGDTANIDYVGKKDGVAFDGGTAEGYDLTIGSNSFIDGFEDGLIGVAIGSTVDLNLTFPEDYGNEELNGAAVVFTVTVNYVKTDEALTPEEFYGDMDFDSVEDYKADAEKRAVKNILLSQLKANSEIKDYPTEDKEFLLSATKEMFINNYLSSYGMDLETYLGYAGQTEEEFDNDMLENDIIPLMDEQMLIYSVLDKAKLTVTSEDITAEAEDIATEINQSSVTAEKVKEYYGEYYLEYLVVNEKVLDHMYDNAVIK